MSRAECEAVFKRVVAMATGGGDTSLTIRSTWTTDLRWVRNRPTTSEDTTEYRVVVGRFQPGGSNFIEVSQLDDTTLKQAVQLLEQRLAPLAPNRRILEPLGRQEYLETSTWSDATARMTAQELSDAARQSVDPVISAKYVSTGYVSIGAASWAIFNTRGLDAYAVATGATYTETVRNAQGTVSGWIGKTHADWNTLDVSALSKVALARCVDATNPVAVEPGRYTAILDADLVGRMMSFAVQAMDRETAENQKPGNVYTLVEGQGNGRGTSKIGHQIFDKRITITSDPTDPECGYMPFDPDGYPYRKVTWVDNGVLNALAYDRYYARDVLRTQDALPNPMAFRISGGPTSIDEMIASTERGLYVTHTSGLHQDENDINDETLYLTCVTRDGLWLIEHGKITHPVKNLWIGESPMTAFNKIVQIGPAVRTYGAVRQGGLGVLRDLPARAVNDGRVPIVAPSMKVNDFNFTKMIDAV